MNELDLRERLKMVEVALDHFYKTDTETLLREYQRYLEEKDRNLRTAATRQVDSDQARAYFGTIPEKCRNNKSLEMKQEMLRALSEEDFVELRQKQITSHPALEAEISSMYEFCLKMKRMMSV